MSISLKMKIRVSHLQDCEGFEDNTIALSQTRKNEQALLYVHTLNRINRVHELQTV